MRKLCFGVVFLLVLGLSGGAWAQTDTASLAVTAVDDTGAKVSGVKITVIGTNNGFLREGTTNSDGIFNLPFLNIGTYQIKAEKVGFNQTELKDVVLHVGDQLSLEVKLKIGSVNETVTVSGGAPLLNTQEASVGTVIDRQFAENLPLNGRSFQALISLTPGVVIAAAGSGAPGQFSINGQRQDSNFFTVDGVSANFGVSPTGDQSSQGGGAGVQTAATGGYNNMVSVDAMQEFKVTTATFAPEYGQTPGGQISIVTRSGTNGFHGDAFEYMRQTFLDANNWFTNSVSGKRPAERQNDYGFVVGGPIWKNKLFFFASDERLRLLVPATQVNNIVPSLCARGTAPATGPTSCASIGGIPAAAAVQPILQAWPVPTATPGNPNGFCTTCAAAIAPELGFQSASFSNPQNIDAWALRLDWNATSKMTFFVRGDDSPTHSSTLSTPTSITVPSIFGLKTFTVGQIYILRSNLVNDARYNYSFANSSTTENLTNFGGAVVPPASIMFPTPYNASNALFFFNGPQIGSLLDGPIGVNFAKQYNIVDTLSWTKGAHQFKFGFTYRRISDQINREAFESQFLYTTVAGTPANPSGLTFINNAPSSYNTANFPQKNFWFTTFGLYAQDTWKLTPRLTLTYGLRWDVEPPPNANSGAALFQALDVVNANYLQSTHVQPAGTPMYHTQWDGFAPRLGVAYQMSRNPKFGSVIRAGYGLFFDDTAIAAGFSESAFASGISNTPPPPFPVLSSVGFVPPIVTSAPFNFVTTVNPNIRMPYTHEFSLAIEQALGSKQTFTITYEGAIGRNLLRRDEYIECQPAGTLRGTANCTEVSNGQFGASFYAIGNDSYSNYNSLQGLYQRNLSHGLLALVSYTWSHCLDTGSFQSDTAVINTFSEPVHDYYGNCTFDIRQSFQTAFSYSLPSVSHNRILDAVIDHWGLDGMFRARTAPPIDLTDSTAFLAAGAPFLAGTTTTNPAGLKVSPRPFINPGVPDYIFGAACAAQYKVLACPGGVGLNPAAFQVLPTNTVVSSIAGTLGRNQLRGYGWNQIDATVRREFPIHESIKLQFRADFFNLFNHPAFFFATGGTGLNVTSAAFGRATSTLNQNLGTGGATGFSQQYQIGGPRSIQLSLKLMF